MTPEQEQRINELAATAMGWKKAWRPDGNNIDCEQWIDRNGDETGYAVADPWGMTNWSPRHNISQAFELLAKLGQPYQITGDGVLINEVSIWESKQQRNCRALDRSLPAALTFACLKAAGVDVAEFEAAAKTK